MASNSFGKHFRITTWGESHGPAIGVVIDGCPSGIELACSDIQEALDKRKPGTSPYVSPRKESDKVEILSGIFEGKTTGAPISLMIRNHDADSSSYEAIAHLFRPGSADFTWKLKYGHRDWRGGGRQSARETAVRVAAGAVAIKILSDYGVKVMAFLKEIGGTECIDQLSDVVEQVKADGDSIGGIIECHIVGLPPGVGDPVFEKLPAKLAEAALSIPAAKGFEIGDGFAAARKRGSEMNDSFEGREGKIQLKSNHAGGTLGGISTGEEVIFRVAFKPASSIAKEQATVNEEGANVRFKMPEGSRHDPAPVIRAVPVVQAMAALVVLDLLFQKEMKPCVI